MKEHKITVTKYEPENYDECVSPELECEDCIFNDDMETCMKFI